MIFSMDFLSSTSINTPCALCLVLTIMMNMVNIIPAKQQGQQTGFCVSPMPGIDATDLLAYQFALPGHGLSGEELQLIVVQTETGQCEQTSEGLGVQVV